MIGLSPCFAPQSCVFFRDLWVFVLFAPRAEEPGGRNGKWFGGLRSVREMGLRFVFRLFGCRGTGFPGGLGTMAALR